MPNRIAKVALNYVLFLAVLRLVASFVALETHFFSAVEGVMSVLPAQNASGSFAFVRTVLRHVAELLAIMAFYGRIFICPIPLSLHFLHFIYDVARIRVFFLFLVNLIRLLGLIFLGEVHVSFEELRSAKSQSRSN